MTGRLLLGCALSALLAGCGSESEPRQASELPEGKIVVTTKRGAAVDFTDFKASCRQEPRESGRKARVVWALAGGRYGTGQRFMLLTAGDGFRGRISLPHIENSGEEETFVSAFVNRAAHATELSSAEELASGSIEIMTASCDPEPRLELTIDAVLESEDSDATATVEGHIRVE